MTLCDVKDLEERKARIQKLLDNAKCTQLCIYNNKGNCYYKNGRPYMGVSDCPKKYDKL
jgi:hypothetical protein